MLKYRMTNTQTKMLSQFWKQLAYEIQKSKKLFFGNFSNVVYLSSLRTSSGSCLITTIILLLLLFKTILMISVKKLCPYFNEFFFVARFYGLGCRRIILRALETFEVVDWNFWGCQFVSGLINIAFQTFFGDRRIKSIIISFV